MLGGQVCPEANSKLLSPQPWGGGWGRVSAVEGLEGSGLQGGLGYASVGRRQSPSGVLTPRGGGGLPFCDWG